MPTQDTLTLTLSADELDVTHRRVLAALVDEIDCALDHIELLLAPASSASNWPTAGDAHDFLHRVRVTIDTLDALGWPRKPNWTNRR